MRGGIRLFSLLMWTLGGLFVDIASAQPDQAGAPEVDAAEAAPPDTDAAATLFLSKCASCHTVGGGAIGDAPDLLPSTQWPRPDLTTAIVRMEKNVGPLIQEEVDQLADLLQSLDVRARLDAARAQREARQRTELAPPSADRGRALFFGERALASRGMACSSCHKAGPRGGTLGRDLTHVFDRMGQTALASAIEGANFPVMRPAYAGAPVTVQEAAHLTKYLETVHAEAADPAQDPPAAFSARLLGWAGLLLAGGALGGSALSLRRVDRGGGVRIRLVRRRTRRSQR